MPHSLRCLRTPGKVGHFGAIGIVLGAKEVRLGSRQFRHDRSSPPRLLPCSCDWGSGHYCRMIERILGRPWLDVLARVGRIPISTPVVQGQTSHDRAGAFDNRTLVSVDQLKCPWVTKIIHGRTPRAAGQWLRELQQSDPRPWAIRTRDFRDVRHRCRGSRCEARIVEGTALNRASPRELIVHVERRGPCATAAGYGADRCDIAEEARRSSPRTVRHHLGPFIHIACCARINSLRRIELRTFPGEVPFDLLVRRMAVASAQIKGDDARRLIGSIGRDRVRWDIPPSA